MFGSVKNFLVDAKNALKFRDAFSVYREKDGITAVYELSDMNDKSVVMASGEKFTLSLGQIIRGNDFVRYGRETKRISVGDGFIGRVKMLCRCITGQAVNGVCDSKVVIYKKAGTIEKKFKGIGKITDHTVLYVFKKDRVRLVIKDEQ